MASPTRPRSPAPRPQAQREPCPAQSSAVWKTRLVLTGPSIVCLARGPGSHDEQRHVHRRLIEEVAVLGFAVVAEALAVIAGNNHRRAPSVRLA